MVLKMKLYKLTNKLGSYYVVATDPTSAAVRLFSLLSEADYGFYEERKVSHIEVIADELTKFAKKPNFSSGNTLILPNSCQE